MKNDILKIVNNEFNNGMFSIKDRSSEYEQLCVKISNEINDKFYDKNIQRAIQRTGLKENNSNFISKVASYILDDIYYEYMTLSQKDVEDVESFLINVGIDIPMQLDSRNKLCSTFLNQIRTIYKRNNFSDEQKQLLLNNFIDWIGQQKELKKNKLCVSIVKQYYNNNMNFLVIKFKSEENENWYLGLSGLFDDDGNFAPVSWSDFDIINKDDNIDKLCHKCMINLLRHYV